jgi:VWFA-related protein
MRSRGYVGATALCALLVLAALLGAAPQQRPPAATFRSRISVVPVDVRVIDADGKPIAGLRAEDFTILEDGKPQEVRHFSEYQLTAEQPEPGAAPAIRGAPGAEVAPPKQRVFLFVMGRGRLDEPSKAMDATLRFVREQLLPQDQVALLAWNRATRFTNDHRKVLATLERFKKGHLEVEALLAQQFSGLQAMYGGREPSAAAQKAIDEVFGAPGGATARKVAAAPVTDGTRLAADTRRDAESLLNAEMVSTHILASPFDETSQLDAARLGMSLDEYVETALVRDQDLANLYTGIEYMRYLEGEKHLVYLTQNGIYLQRVEDDLGLAAMANDARVVLDTIQVGGIAGPPPVSAGGTRSVQEQLDRYPKRMVTAPPQQMFAIQTLKLVSELTGGVSSVMSYASTGLDRIDQTTRSGYLLAYYPSNANWDGKYRKIEVKVNRPGARVLFRHGYYGRDQLVPLDRKAFITFNRVSAAAYNDRPMNDIPVKLRAVVTGAGPGSAGEAVVEVTVDVSRIGFLSEADRRVASLDIDIFCGDDKENLVGETWEKADLRLFDATYQRLLKTGLVHTARIPLKDKPRYVKAVVYDYAADMLGSAVVTVK